MQNACFENHDTSIVVRCIEKISRRNEKNNKEKSENIRCATSIHNNVNKTRFSACKIYSRQAFNCQANFL